MARGRKGRRARQDSRGAGRGSSGPDGSGRLVVGGPHAVEACLEGADLKGAALEGRSARRSRVHRVFLETGAGRRASALAAEAREAGLPVSMVGPEECDELAGVRCQGVAAEVTFEYSELDDVLAGPPGLLLFLDEISDPHNLGALIRTAEAAGAIGVVVPSRRSAAVSAAVVRVSAGAALSLPVCRVTNLVRAMESAAAEGYWIVGLDHEADHDVRPAEIPDGGSPRAGLVVGAEGTGLRRLVSERCDELARLPMRGSVESLNASVAGGIAIYRLLEGRLYAKG